MTEVYLLWEQGKEIRKIVCSTGGEYTSFHPKLVGVFKNSEYPERMAREWNDVHRYSSRWVSSAPVEEET